jgi:hypothetical protein
MVSALRKIQDPNQSLNTSHSRRLFQRDVKGEIIATRVSMLGLASNMCCVG